MVASSQLEREADATLRRIFLVLDVLMAVAVLV